MLCQVCMDGFGFKPLGCISIPFMFVLLDMVQQVPSQCWDINLYIV